MTKLIGPVKYKGKVNVSLQELHSAFLRKADIYDVDVISKKEVRSDVERLVIYHPQHKNEYFQIVAEISRSKSMSWITVYSSGSSRQLKSVHAMPANRRHLQEWEFYDSVLTAFEQAIV
ncbi:MAG: hypothetical protein LBU32_09675 [Clostridiales bacterium]|nr:hypothetical protein [Clostridiales bacterium]